MKILYVIPAIGEIYGGPSKVVEALGRKLPLHGIGVDVATTDANGPDRIKTPLQEWIAEQGYRIRYFPFYKNGEYKFSFSLTQWLLREVVNYDLVHTHALFSYPVLPAYWACQKFRIPYMVTPHGMLEPWALSYKGWKKKPYFDFLEKPALEKASALHVHSSAEAEHIQSLKLKTPAVIIPNGIHKEEFETLPSPELFYKKFPETKQKRILLFLGRIDPKKGLNLLVPAFAMIKEKIPQGHLVLAGPDSIGYMADVKRICEKTNCLSQVTFTGMLRGPLKFSAFSASALFVAPSYSEGFSVSILEGMACGRPCIITPGCNFDQAGEAHAAYIVEPRAEAIAAQAIHCLENVSEAEETGRRARRFIFENYTWDRIARLLAEKYRDIVDAKKSRLFSSNSGAS